MVLSAYSELPVPLWEDEYGVICIANTRITLDVIIAAYQHGETPNGINRGFPTLKLADIYAVLAYYLSHRELVDTYLRERDEQSGFVPVEYEAQRPSAFDFHARLIQKIMH